MPVVSRVRGAEPAHVSPKPILGEGVPICREGSRRPSWTAALIFRFSSGINLGIMYLYHPRFDIHVLYSCSVFIILATTWPRMWWFFFCPESMPCMCAVISVHMHVYQSFFAGFSLLRVVIGDEDFFSPDLISAFHAELPIGCNISHKFGNVVHCFAFAFHRQVRVILRHLSVCMSQYRPYLVYGRSAGTH